MSTTMSPIASARAELGAFADRLIGPDDTGYDEARALFNAMVDKRPAVIARCETADDVVAAIRFARESTTCRSPYAAAATTGAGLPAPTTASSSISRR